MADEGADTLSHLFQAHGTTSMVESTEQFHKESYSHDSADLLPQDMLIPDDDRQDLSSTDTAVRQTYDDMLLLIKDLEKEKTEAMSEAQEYLEQWQQLQVDHRSVVTSLKLKAHAAERELASLKMDLSTRDRQVIKLETHIQNISSLHQTRQAEQSQRFEYTETMSDSDSADGDVIPKLFGQALEEKINILQDLTSSRSDSPQSPGEHEHRLLKSALSSSRELISKLNSLQKNDMMRASTPTHIRPPIFNGESPFVSKQVQVYDIDTSAVISSSSINGDLAITIGNIAKELASNIDKASEAEHMFERILADNQSELNKLHSALEQRQLELEQYSRKNAEQKTCSDEKIKELEAQCSELRQKLETHISSFKNLKSPSMSTLAPPPSLVMSASSDDPQIYLSQIADLKQQVDHKVSLCNALESDLVESQKQVIILQEGEENLKSLLERAQSIHKLDVERVTETERQLSRFKNEKATVESRTKKSATEMTATIEALQNSLSSQKQKCQQLESQVPDLEIERDAMKQTISKANREILNKEREMSLAESHVKSMNTQLEKLRAKNLELVTENGRLSIKSHELLTSGLQDHIVQQLREELESQNQAYDENLNHLRDEVQVYKSKCATAQTLIQRLSPQVQKFKDEVSGYQAKLRSASAEKVRLELQLNDLTSTLHQERDEAERNASLNEEAQQSLAESNQIIQAHLKEREDKISQISKKLATVEKNESLLRADLKRLQESANKSSTGRTKELELQLSKANDRNAQLSDAIAEVTEKRRIHQERVLVLEDKIAKLSIVLDTIQTLHAKHTELESKVESNGVILAQSNVQREQFAAKIQQLERDLSLAAVSKDSAHQFKILQEQLRKANEKLAKYHGGLGMMAQSKRSFIQQSPMKKQLALFDSEISGHIDEDILDKVHKLDQMQLKNLQAEKQELVDEQIEMYKTIESLQEDVDTIKANAAQDQQRILELEDLVQQNANELAETVASADSEMKLSQEISDAKIQDLEETAFESSKTIEELSQIRDSLRYEIETLKSTASAQDTKCEKLDAELEALKSQLYSEALEHRDKLDDMKEQLKASLDDAEEVKSRLSSEAASLIEELKSANVAYAALNQKLDAEKRSHLDDLDSFAAEKAEICSQFSNDVESLKEEFARSTDDYKNQVVHLESSIKSEQDKTHYSNERVRLLEADLDAAKVRFESLVVEMITKESDLQRITKEIATLVANSESREKDLSRQSESSTLEKARVESLLAELDTKEIELQQRTQEFAVLVCNSEAREKELSKQSESSTKELHDQIRSLKRERSALEKTTKSLREDLDRSNVELAQVNERFYQAQSQLSSTHSQLAGLKDLMRDMDEESNQKDEKIQSLSLDVLHKTSQIAQLKSEASSRELEFQQFAAMLKECEGQVQLLEANLDDQKIVQASLEKTLHATTGSLDALRWSIAECQTAFFAKYSLGNDVPGELAQFFSIAHSFIDGKLAAQKSVNGQNLELAGRLRDQATFQEAQSEKVLELTQDKEALESSIASKKKVIATMEHANRGLKNTVKEYGKELKSKVAQVDSLKADVESLSVMARSSDTEKFISQIQTQQDEIVELRKANEQIAEILEDRAAVKARLDQVSSQYESVTKSKAILVDKQRDILAEMDSVKNKLQLKTGEVSIIQVQFETLRRDNNELKDKNAAFKTLVSDVEKRSKEVVANIESELHEITKQYEHYEGIARELQQVNQDLQSALANSRASQERMEQSISDMQVSQTKLREQLDSVINDRAHLKTSMQHKTDIIADLQMKLSTRPIFDVDSLTAHQAKSEEMRLQFEKLLLQMEKEMNVQKRKIKTLQSELKLSEAKNAELAGKAEHNDNEAHYILKQLGDAATVLKETDRSVLFNVPPETDIEKSFDELEKNIDKIVSNSLTEAGNHHGDHVTGIVKSLADTPLVEVVSQYEKKLQTLHILLEKGEEALRCGIEMVVKKEQRRAKKRSTLSHSQHAHKENARTSANFAN